VISHLPRAHLAESSDLYPGAPSGSRQRGHQPLVGYSQSHAVPASTGLLGTGNPKRKVPNRQVDSAAVLDHERFSPVKLTEERQNFSAGLARDNHEGPLPPGYHPQRLPGGSPGVGPVVQQRAIQISEENQLLH
jgi:hypothetical protein